MSDLKGLRDELRAVEQMIHSGELDEIKMASKWGRIVDKIDSIENKTF